MTKTYKVFFHHGDELTARTRALKGSASIDESGLHIAGPSGVTTIPNVDMLKADLFRLHGVGRVIQLDYKGGRVFMSVIRFMVGQFALINFFRTGELQRRLAAIVKPN